MLPLLIGIALLFCVYYIHKTQNPIKETIKNSNLKKNKNHLFRVTHLWFEKWICF